MRVLPLLAAAARRARPLLRAGAARARPAVRPLLEGIGLAGVLVFVAAVTYLPHLDPPPPDRAEPSLPALADAYRDWAAGDHLDYPFPIHVDENAHWVFVSALQRQGTLKYDDPYTGAPRAETPLALKGLVHEQGFHVALAQFQSFTGIDWVTVFRFLPSAWMAVTAAAVWAALRPSPGALPAAALIALAPTSLRFLGPGFLVPVGFALAWLAAALALSRGASRDPRAAVLLLLVVVWAFFVHLIAGFAVLLALLVQAPFSARRDRREALLIGAVAAVPLLWIATAFGPDVARESRIFNFLPIDFTIFDQIGIPFLYAWVASLGLLALRPPRVARRPVLVAAALSVLSLAFIVGNVALGIRRYALYDRWHQVFLIVGAVPVGWAIGELAALAGSTLRKAWAAFAASGTPVQGPAPPPGGASRRVRSAAARAGPAAAAALSVFLALGALVYVVDSPVGYHMREPYYRITNRGEFGHFLEAAGANDTYEVFLVHPWKAPVYTALSGKKPYAVLYPGEPPFHGAEYRDYVRGRHADGAWLVSRDISQVVDSVQPAAPEFVSFGPQDSRLAWPWAQRLAEIRAQP